MFSVNNRYIRDCLCKRCIDRTSVAQATVKFTWSFFGRTFFLADTTACTFIHVYASCFFTDINRKITYESAYFFYFTICIQRDLFMCRSFHHFRCQDTCRTVQRRECLIDLGHSSSDTRLFLHDIYFISGICDINRCLNTCDTAADNQCTFCYTALTRLKRCI